MHRIHARAAFAALIGLVASLTPGLANASQIFSAEGYCLSGDLCGDVFNVPSTSSPLEFTLALTDGAPLDNSFAGSPEPGTYIESFILDVYADWDDSVLLWSIDLLGYYPPATSVWDLANAMWIHIDPTGSSLRTVSIGVGSLDFYYSAYDNEFDPTASELTATFTTPLHPVPAPNALWCLLSTLGMAGFVRRHRS